MNGSRKTDPRDFLPAASLETLRLRAKLLAAVRKFFDVRGYWEVETPILSHDVVVDAFLEPFTTHWRHSGADEHDAGTVSGDRVFLQTSPEFGMKRLLAAGAHDIYQITRAMRNGEVGCYHNPEFTLIEWYRVGDTHHQQMQVVEDLVVHVFRSATEFQDNVRPQRTQATGLPAMQVEQPFERLTYDEAFEKHTGSRVLGLATSQLAELAGRLKIVPPAGLAADDRDGWLNLLLAERVEPNLGRDRPVFLYDYPASQAALARVRQEESPVAERFELYVQGIEICNGYHELTDPQEFRQRIQRQTDLRDREGFPKLPQENRLLDAMEAGLPDCAGVALGFDRLVMSSLGAASVAEVMAFPFDRA